jgi:Uma2 family endonuclease
MSTARRYRNTYGDFLRVEEASPIKFEFSDGEIFAMAGGTPAHGALAMQLVRLLGPLLPSTCTFLSSDVKVRVLATELATYPDVSIVCGPLELSPDDANAVTNPRFVFEVTSASTEDYDRGAKLSQYKQLKALETVVLVSHRQRLVTCVRRRDNAWAEIDARPGERAELAAGLSFDVAELYAVLDGIGAGLP